MIPPLTSYKPRANYLAAKSDDLGSVAEAQGGWRELTRATVCMRSENPSLWSRPSSTLGPRDKPGSKRLNLMAHLASLQTVFKVHQSKLQQVH